MEIAPYKDFEGNTIFNGSVISHPSGQRGTVVFKSDRPFPEDQWLVDYGDGVESRLCLQVGDRGRAVVAEIVGQDPA